MLHGDRLRDKDTRIPVAHTPAQQRCVGDKTTQVELERHPVLLCLKDPFSGLLAYSTSPVSFRHSELMVFTTVCVGGLSRRYLARP